MAIKEKMPTIGWLWGDLWRNAADRPAPVWHMDILREREDLLKRGEGRIFGLEQTGLRTTSTPPWERQVVLVA